MNINGSRRRGPTLLIKLKVFWYNMYFCFCCYAVCRWDLELCTKSNTDLMKITYNIQTRKGNSYNALVFPRPIFFPTSLSLSLARSFFFFSFEFHQARTHFVCFYAIFINFAFERSWFELDCLHFLEF